MGHLSPLITRTAGAARHPARGLHGPEPGPGARRLQDLADAYASGALRVDTASFSHMHGAVVIDPRDVAVAVLLRHGRWA